MKVWLVVIDYRKGDGASVLGPFDSRGKANAALCDRREDWNHDDFARYMENGGHEDESFTILEREVT